MYAISDDRDMKLNLTFVKIMQSLFRNNNKEFLPQLDKPLKNLCESVLTTFSLILITKRTIQLESSHQGECSGHPENQVT